MSYAVPITSVLPFNLYEVERVENHNPLKTLYFKGNPGSFSSCYFVKAKRFVLINGSIKEGGYVTGFPEGSDDLKTLKIRTAKTDMKNNLFVIMTVESDCFYGHIR